MKKSRWSIIFENDDFLVVNKPAGWLSIPDRFDHNQENLLSSLQAYRGEVFVNHRLDKDTSGLIVFTKHAESHKDIQEQFEAREVEKYYYAIVMGVPPLEVGQVDLSLSYNNKIKRTVVSENGKEALTIFRVVEDWDDFSLLEIRIKTGRTHQIRAHMRAIGHPLLCDDLYGDGKPFLLSAFKRKYNPDQNYKERPLLDRTALHAHKISFRDPSSKEKVSFEEDLPKDMRSVVYQLQKIKS